MRGQGRPDSHRREPQATGVPCAELRGNIDAPDPIRLLTSGHRVRRPGRMPGARDGSAEGCRLGYVIIQGAILREASALGPETSNR